MHHQRIFLIGYRGTGKTTVGRLLADRLGWAFADSDDHIEEGTGQSIADLFASEGEAGFRDREAAVLSDLATRERIVIATGGGTVLRPANREQLQSSGFVAWLAARPETVWGRLQCDPATGTRRPNLTTAGGIEEVAGPHCRSRAAIPRGRPFRCRRGCPIAGSRRRCYPQGMAWIAYLPVVLWCLTVFAFGLAVGSFLNVLIARLPFEKSIVWPSSRCFVCFTPIRAFDNIPIVGYLRLRGKCRNCGATFSRRYLWVEIGTGLGFLGLFVAGSPGKHLSHPGT